MSKNKFWWRRKFSEEYLRADYDCEEVWIRNDKFLLVKYPDSHNVEGKWRLFTPLDKDLGKTTGKKIPIEWANSIIIKEMK